MSMFSKIIDKVLPGAPSRNFTENTWDKILAPETKDTAEQYATMIALTAAGVPPQVAQGLGSWGATGNKQGLILAGLGIALPNLPGDIGKFFQESDLGKQLMAAFAGFGGDSGLFGSFLNGLGLGGKTGGAINDLLTVMALSALSEVYAKDAVKKANALEAKQSAIVDQLVTKAQEMSDPKVREQNVQKALETVSTEYKGQRTAMEQNLYGRGMGASTQGPVAALGMGEAEGRLKARRDIESNWPMQALQALSYATGPVSQLSTQARTAADAKLRAIPELYAAVTAANRQSPMDAYTRQKLIDAGIDPDTGKPIPKQVPALTPVMPGDFPTADNVTSWTFAQDNPLLFPQTATPAATPLPIPQQVQQPAPIPNYEDWQLYPQSASSLVPMKNKPWWILS